MKELHELIRDLREDRDIRQKTVAEYLNVSQQTYSNYENGHREIPIRVIIKLADYYEVSTDYLLGANRHYAGSTDLGRKYVGAITMHDIVYEIQKLSPQNKRSLLKCIRFLKESEQEK